MASESSGSSRFFVLKSDYRGPQDTEFTMLDDNVGEAPRCERCGDIVGMLPWLPPYRVTLELYGGELGDFISGFGCTALLSERFTEAIRAEGLQGFRKLHAVEVTKVRRQRRGPKPAAPRYFLFETPFGSAAVDEVHSRIRRASPISCDWCRETGVDAVHGFALEPGSWNGDDIFQARGMPGKIIVSERFARFANHHGFTNMRMIPTEEFTRDPRAAR